ncbi:MFS transporter [Paenarthrobacter sp. DKR-5]|uniref:MFS transporter n=1 Tax=Paenarthrobacter sp. DKR-5 TaxID=2835535 RepID=UPI001BDD4BA7|nr:MFS transporter [Paenarthrobacter sp. DKR-5]MBT1003106.1 MFS transporter [Paenarthrobacter sp. DKR-5]
MKRGFRGRLLVLVGVLLVAFTLRMAVTSVPPLLSAIGAQVPLDAAATGLLGMLPTACFAVFGFLTPFVTRWASLERLAVLAMGLAVAGQLGRALVSDTTLFLVFSVVALAGLGAGNVVLPPLVRQYFPDRVGLVTALYVATVSLGTAVPPVFAVPVADAAGWQVSTAVWAAFSVAAALPWLAAYASRGRKPAGAAQPGREAAPAAEPPVRINLWRSPLAIGLTLMMGCTSLNTYAMFAWMPAMLTEAGLGRADAGTQLGWFSVLGLPLGLLVPLFAARLRNPLPLVAVFVCCFAAGYLGLWLAPASATLLWVTLAGLGPGTFPLSLVLVNLRSRTHAVTGALSGFSQGLGYALACLGPLLFGLIHEATGGWGPSFGFLFATLAVLFAGAWFACRPQMVEDHPGVIS